jgi:DNA-binding response OmpR family regulator
MKKELIGQILAARFGVDVGAIRNALARQKVEKRRLCSLLLREGAAAEETLASALGRQLGVPAIVLSKSRFPLAPLSLIPRDVAVKEMVLPLLVEGDKMLIAAVDPHRKSLFSELAFVSGKQVAPHVAVETALMEAADEAYRTAAVSKDGLWTGRAAPRTAGRDPVLEIITEEMAFIEEETPVPAEFVIVSTADDLENIVAGKAIAGGEKGSTPRVLVVDDEPDILELLNKTMQAEGYEVHTAARGGEALQKLQSLRPDLVVLDAMLPEVHGFDICMKIKSSEIYRHIPVLMISAVYTGWRFQEDIKLTYGADDFLEKPFRLGELTRKVRVLLERTHGHSEPITGDVPVSVRACYENGGRLLKEGRPDQAAAEFGKGIGIDPFSYRLHYALAIACQQQGQLYQAMSEYEKAVDLRPTFYPALKNLAVIYQQKGFRNKARETWERAMGVAPDDETRKAIRDHVIKLL